MEQSGATKAKRTKASSGEDHLSALPDDVLILILLRLHTIDAARTSLLSRRWHHVWTLLPELHFNFVRDSRFIRSALSTAEVPLRILFVGDLNASPQSLAAWLPAAARRVSGVLCLINFGSGTRAAAGDAEAASQRGTFELPCFEKATLICLDLGFLGLSMSPAGVFARLTELFLTGARFHGPAELGDVVSSPRCPCLQKLTIKNVWGLDSITINSSLQLLDLKDLRHVRQITVVAPALKDFNLLQCFIHDQNQSVATIPAPQLKSLNWFDAYDPSSVHLGTVPWTISRCLAHSFLSTH